MISHFKKMDWWLIGSVLGLSLIGLVCIYSGSRGNLVNFQKQIFFVFLGLVLMFLFSFFDYRLFKNYRFVIMVLYLFSVMLLLVLLLTGPKIRGTVSWFRLGIFSFEPVELTKLVLILLLAKYFSMRHIEMYRIRHLIISGLYVIIPSIIVLAQPDFGSVLILAGIWLGIVLVAGIKPRHLLILILVGLVIGGIFWIYLLKDYQKQRILTFLNPKKDPLGYGYNLRQSLIAVGQGKLLGEGFRQGSQTQLLFLPECQTDFIFGVLAEEWGFLGVTILLVLLGVMFWRIIKIALLADNNFSRLYAVGLVILLFVQSFINIGMNVGLLPITGLGLPLVSYGGSNLLSIFIALGILQSIKVGSSQKFIDYQKLIES